MFGDSNRSLFSSPIDLTCRQAKSETELALHLLIQLLRSCVFDLRRTKVREGKLEIEFSFGWVGRKCGERQIFERESVID